MHKWRDHHVHQTAIDITASAGDVLVFDVAHPVRVFELDAIVTTAIVIATATRVDAVFSLDLMDHDRSTRTEKCTLTLDAARAVGHRDYVKLEGPGTETAFDVQPGQACVLEHKTAASGTAAAGGVKVGIKYAILSDANRDATYDHVRTS